jgi:serine/threonine-protein kinase
MDPQQGPPQPDLIGQTIGNYLVTQKLGEGGMGSVYLAEHPSIGKKVALKVLHSEFSNNQEVTERFFHEAKAVNDIGHPNIVDIVDFGVLQAGYGREQLVYFIMEYLAGATLSQVIHAEAPLPPERALSIAIQVADALAASHHCGIVHRDLKPDNIILLQRGRERDFVKLLDFGIAKLTGGSSTASHRTRTGLVMGTPAYMSPEQCEGRASVDTRTDVYALGIVLYEMLTRRVPFVGEGYGEILVQHLTQRPVPPSQFRVLPPHVEVVVLKALEKRVELRYPTMEEFMRAMADPVGYVEAHGGVAAFLQRQLVPSNAPLPSVRLTPAPLLSLNSPTPPPGSLTAQTGRGVPPSMSGAAPTAPGQPVSSAGMSPAAAAPTVAGAAPSVHRSPPSMHRSPSSVSGMATVGLPQVPGITTPVPTTLGSAAGQVHASRSRTGYIIAGLLIAAAAIAAIIVVASNDKVPLAAAGGGSQVASGGAATGSDGTAGAGGAAAGTTGSAADGAAGTTANGAGGTASGGTTGNGAGDPTAGANGAGSTAAGGTASGGTTANGAGGTSAGGTTANGAGGTSADGTTAGAAGGTTANGTGGTSAGGTTANGAGGTSADGTTAGAAGGTTANGTSGSTRNGVAGAGSSGHVIDDTTEVDVRSSPPGARIYVDNVDQERNTPAKLHLSRAGHSISIMLRLKGYESYTFKPVDVRAASQQTADLVKSKSTTSTSKCKTSEHPGCTRDSKGCCVGEGSGAKQGSATQVPDRDDLMRP